VALVHCSMYRYCVGLMFGLDSLGGASSLQFVLIMCSVNVWSHSLGGASSLQYVWLLLN